MSPTPRSLPRALWQGALAVVVVAASLAFYARLHTLALPEHSIQFAVHRDGAAQRAEAFLHETAQADLSGYTTATVWDTDEPQKTYLEKELGVARTAQLADEVALWGFRTRYFKPLQKDEYQVFVQPDGAVAGYRHVVDESAPGARLSREDALAVAEAARRDVARLPGEWRLVEGSSAERPARLDWQFTWERTDAAARAGNPPLPDDAEVRWTAVVQGDDLGGFNLFLKVPEQWTRGYQGVRSANSLTLAVDGGLLFLPLALVALFITVRIVARGGAVPRAIGVMAALAAIITALDTLNALPVDLASYNTLSSWEAFLAQHVLLALLEGFPEALGIVVFAVAGASLYRRMFPDHLSLRSSLTWRGMMSRPGAVALAVGVVFAAVAIAYQVGYYLVGTHIGFWVPAETNYDNLYSVFAPWLDVPAIGYLAAAFEESAFRLFAIPLFTMLFVRLLRGHTRVALAGALVISAASWGFLHASYPQDPFYARGIELTLAGILWGWVMVRYGILASMSAHYTFDAFAGASALQAATSLPTTIVAYAFTALPLGVAAIAAATAWRRGGFVPTEGLINGEVEGAAPGAPAAVPSIERPSWRYVGLSTRWRIVLLAVAGVSLTALVAAHVLAPAKHATAFHYPAAVERAKAALAAQGVDVTDYQAAATLDSRDRGLADAYLRDVASKGAEGEVYGAFIPEATWTVRFTRPLQRDEYRVELLPDAAPTDRPFSVTFDLAETTTGARLAPDDALALAEDYLAGQPGWSKGNATVVDQSQVDRPDRTDYQFVFERSDVRYADATLRANLEVVGDHASGYSPYVKIPEQWQRDHSTTGTRQIAIMAIGIAYILGLVCLDFGEFLRLIRAGALAWRVPLLVGLGFALAGLIGEINDLPVLFAGYSTSTPVQTFFAETAIQKLVSILLTALLAGYLTADLLGLWRARVSASVAPASRRRAWALDAALLAVALPLTALAVLGASGDTTVASDVTVPSSAASIVPALAEVIQARLGLLAVMVAIIAVLHLKALVRRDRWVILAVAPLGALAPLSAPTATDAVEEAIVAAAAISVGALVARFLLRGNLAAYVATAVLAGMLTGVASLAMSVDGWLVGNGLVLALLSVLMLAGLLWWGRRQTLDSSAE